jgi:hypothetical protein
MEKLAVAGPAKKEDVEPHGFGGYPWPRLPQKLLLKRLGFRTVCARSKRKTIW